MIFYDKEKRVWIDNKDDKILTAQLRTLQSSSLRKTFKTKEAFWTWYRRKAIPTIRGI